MATAEHPGADLMDLPQGSHVCWVVADGGGYERTATAILEGGRTAGEKLFAFGPADSPVQPFLAAAGATTADPHQAFLSGGPLDPQKMYAMFRDQVATARAEGFTGLRLVADMDWLRPLHAPTGDVVAFETVLDRVVGELGATVVCAYRRSTFDEDAIRGVAAVHPVVSGTEKLFELISTGPSAWRLSGEVDICVLASFSAALDAALADGPATIDVEGLRFIDCAGMRTMARALAATPNRARFRGVGPSLHRLWEVTGMDAIAPLREVSTDAA